MCEILGKKKGAVVIDFIEVVVLELGLENKIGDVQAETQTGVFQAGRQCSLPFSLISASRSNLIRQPTQYLMGHGA